MCARAGLAGIDLCGGCLAHLPALVGGVDGAPTVCLRCGGPVGAGGGTVVRAGDAGPSCARCAARPGPFARIVAPYRYAWPLDGLVRRWKHDGDRALGRVLGTLLGRAALAADGAAGASASSASGRACPEAPGGTCLVAVPTHPARLAVRGFDHGADLARWAGRAAGVPVLPAARRIEDTGSLAELPRAARLERVRGAFAVDDAVAGRRVCLVDDVLTTGATSGELARECYDTGAASVELWVVARTPSGDAPPEAGPPADGPPADGPSSGDGTITGSGTVPPTAGGSAPIFAPSRVPGGAPATSRRRASGSARAPSGAAAPSTAARASR